LPTTSLPSFTASARSRLNSLALACACVFVATLPFHHLLAFRSTALGLAALLTFVAGGWREMPKLPLIAGWAAWMICAGISVVYARNHTVALSEYRYEVLYTFGTWATCYTLARRHGGARWLGRVVVAATLVALVLGIALFVPGQPWFDLGRYGDVGTVSTFLVTVLPVFLLFALRSKPHSAARVGALAVAAGCLAAGFLTLNRMFWLATAAEITIFALLSMRYWNSRFRTASMLAVGAIVALLAAIEVFTTSESRIALAAPGTGVWEFLSGDPRGDLWPFATSEIALHPWIGSGLGKWSSREVFIAHFNDPLLMHAHNMFLNRALETGVPGLLAFILLIGQVALAFWRVARSADPGIAEIGAAGLALVAGVVIKNLTDDFFVRQNALLFWSLVGAGLGAAAARQQAIRAAATPVTGSPG
jgi:O-antigen ligase